MSEQNLTKAFVFDTNFIIQYQDMARIVDSLKGNYSVYAMQLSIDERIAQQCREQKKVYEELSKMQEEHKDIAKIVVKVSYDSREKWIRQGLQKNYARVFNERIIPFQVDSDSFLDVINRAHQKKPPFSQFDSDKGFKDTLLWLSLLSFFKDGGEDSVLFLTNDEGFLKNASTLAEEFKQRTGKHIEIKDNAHYKQLVKDDDDVTVKSTIKSLPDVKLLREMISEVFESIRLVEDVDYYGNELWEKTFTLSAKFDPISVASCMNSLSDVITQNLFDQRITAGTLFGNDERVINGDANIDMTLIEQAADLHTRVAQDYPDYLNQFYSTVTDIFNKNYSAPQITYNTDDDLPF